MTPPVPFRGDVYAFLKEIMNATHSSDIQKKYLQTSLDGEGVGVSLWLPSLFSAEAIPSAIITFVALLMFLQLGVKWEVSTLLCGLLTLPWMMKSWLREPLQHWGHYLAQLRFVEAVSFLLLVALAFSFTARTDSQLWVLLCLLLLCLFSAWHELVSHMYYDSRLRGPQQRFYNVARMSFSQAAVILTYGVMIVAVGSLEVFYHNRRQVIAESWSTAVYLLAGVYLLLLLWNLCCLPQNDPSPVGERRQVVKELLPAASLSHGRVVCGEAFALFLLLLPQALMFHARVLYLMASQTEGGLGCSLQEVGLAQGTVGVIAFSVGLILGHRLIDKNGKRARLLFSMLIPLGLSPSVYWLMTQYPPANLLWLCVATATAQFCFGYGLNLCSLVLRHLFGHRYESTINYLYVPLISFVMLPAMAASGWLVARLGFEHFFTLDALLAIFAWMAGWCIIYQYQDSNNCS